MKQVKGLTKKMAGKSLPIEVSTLRVLSGGDAPVDNQKLCVRKTRKFETQGHYLFLPGLELAYVYGSLFHTPRRTLMGTHLPRIERQLERLKDKGPEAYGMGYWDGESGARLRA
jgi:hypothetical protein